MAETGPFSLRGCRSLFHQPASIGRSGGCAALETGTVFGIKGLQDSGSAVELPLGAEREGSVRWGLGFGLSRVGFSTYQSLTALSGVSLTAGRGAIGISARYVNQRFGGGYLDDHLMEMDLGAVADVSERIKAGLAVQQLVEWHPGSKIGVPPPRSPLGFEPGASWMPTDRLTLIGSAGFRSGRLPQRIGWNGAVEWRPVESVILAVARRSDPALSAASVRIAIRHASVGMRSMIHPDLGLQHVAGFEWRWNR